MQAAKCLIGRPAVALLAPSVGLRPQISTTYCRQLALARSSSTPAPSVTDEEAERFEKIAAALVEKMKDLPDTEGEPEGN